MVTTTHRNLNLYDLFLNSRNKVCDPQSQKFASAITYFMWCGVVNMSCFATVELHNLSCLSLSSTGGGCPSMCCLQEMPLVSEGACVTWTP